MGISRQEIQELIERPVAAESRVLSVYLQIDQSQQSNLNHGYLAAFKDRLREIDRDLVAEELKQDFASDAERAVQLVSKVNPRGRTLVLFSSRDGYEWRRELRVPIRTQVRWEEKPYVRPLVEALDEYERYAVVLVSRQQARLFLFHVGEIEERKEVFASAKIRQAKAAGTGGARSPINLQRREEELAHAHLKNVCQALEELAGRQSFDRLVLAGPHEVTTELEGLLPKRLQGLVVRRLTLELDAGEQQVLQETQAIEGDVERGAERGLVEKLITQASKEARAVLELRPTLEAMRLGRIFQLLYVEGFTAPGARCSNCQSLFAEVVASCPYCNGAVRPVSDVVERLVELVVDSDAEAEMVRGAPAERLRAVGGIGAFLRF